MKKYKTIMIILAILLVGIFVVAVTYNWAISPVSKKSDPVTITIKEGSTPYTIGDTLYENKLIKSKKIYKVYVKVNGIKDIKASTYELNRNMSLKEIMDTLAAGNAYNPNEIRITFKEGLNVRKIARLIEEKTNNSYDDVINLMADNEYIDSLVNKYWFLTDSV